MTACRSSPASSRSSAVPRARRAPSAQGRSACGHKHRTQRVSHEMRIADKPHGPGMLTTLCATATQTPAAEQRAPAVQASCVALCLATFVCRLACAGGPAVGARIRHMVSERARSSFRNKRRVCWPPPPPTCLAHDDSLAVLYDERPLGGRARSRVPAFLRVERPLEGV